VEPQQRARQLRDRLGETVVTLHVRQLVEQHRAAQLERPLVGARRQQHARMDEAERDGNRECRPSGGARTAA
jgi:ribosomal protein L34E